MCELRTTSTVYGSPAEIPTEFLGHARINYTDTASLTEQLKLLISQQAGLIAFEASQRYARALRANLCSLEKLEPGLKIDELAGRFNLEAPKIEPAVNQLVSENRIKRRGSGAGTQYYAASHVPSFIGASASVVADSNRRADLAFVSQPQWPADIHFNRNRTTTPTRQRFCSAAPARAKGYLKR